ncbi:hypothetical protein GPJ56_000889 [Histomonas meleagridis]|uniref:uncharacterized protein n=1 Tax=Histomonas meleagridis TaxID=135588 RepID=UPI00355A714C|nr:hypothetical protein GPJ56_000889 [Histomonas meleagridis]KAH0801281.1 hypothetical protein GO595_005876 [Histomonas meleagridis]
MGRRSCNYRRIKYIIFRPRANETVTLEIDKQKFTDSALIKLEQLESYNQNKPKDESVSEHPCFPQPMQMLQMYPPFIPAPKTRQELIACFKHTPPMLRGKKGLQFVSNNQNVQYDQFPNFSLFPVENGNVQMI